MAKSRQVIRQVQRSGAANFDEQMWPINAMLVLLAACLAGVVVALSRFDDSRFFYNAWTHLAGIAIILIGLLIGTHKLQSRIKNRRMQLSIVVALFCYFWLIVAMYELGFSLVAVSDEPSSETLGEQLVQVPEYVPDQPSQHFENPLTQPTEAQTFDQERLDVRPDSNQPAAETRPQDNEPTTVPDVPDPNIAMNRQVAVPRRSTSPGGSLSRSEIADRLRPSDPAQVPAMPREDVDVERQLNSEPTPVERQQPVDPSLRQRVDPQPRPTAVAVETDATLQRRVADQPRPDVSSDASPVSRSVTSPQISSVRAPAIPQPLAETNVNRPAQPQPTVATNRSELPAQRHNTNSGHTATNSEINDSQLARRDSQQLQPTINDSAQAQLARNDSRSALSDSPTANPAPTAMPSNNSTNNSTANDVALQPSEAGATRNDSSLAETSARRGDVASSSAPSPADLSSQRMQQAGGSSAQPSLAEASPGSSPAARQSGGGLVAARSVPLEPAATAGASNRSAGELRPAAGDVGRSESGERVAVSRPAAGSGNLPATREGALPSTQMTRSGSQTGIGSPNVGQGEPVAMSRSSVGQLAGGDQAADDPSGAPSIAESTGQTPGLMDSSNTVARNEGAAGGASQRRDSGGGMSADNNSAIGDSSLAAQTSGGSSNSRPSLNPGSEGSGILRRSGSANVLNPGSADDTTGAENIAGSRSTGDSPQLAEAPNRGNRLADDGSLNARRRQSGSQDSISDNADLASGGLSAPSSSRGNRPQLSGSDNRLAGSRSNRDAGELSAAPAAAGGGEETLIATNEGSSVADSGPTTGVSGERSGTELSGTRNRVGGQLPGGGTGDVALSREPLSRASGGAANGPQLGEDTPGRSSRRRNEIVGLTAGSALKDDPGPQPGGESRARADVGTLGPAASKPTRSETNSLLARGRRTPGAGGVNNDILGDPGQLSRHARDDSDVLDTSPRRFNLDKRSGSLAADLKADDVPAAFRDRDPGRRAELAEDRGGNASSEAAIERGLEFLARHQEPDGHWSLNEFARGRNYGAEAGEGSMESDSAATGLSLLAFLGAGYTHERGKYQDEVTAALSWLIDNQQEDGDLFSGVGGSKFTWLYSHGIAAIALCEAYGMTQDPNLRVPAQRALDFIAAAQEPVLGGWRYAPRVGTDTSVSGWQMMALKSGELAGLSVDPKCYSGVDRWLRSAEAPSNPATYIYRPGSEQLHQRTPSLAMTAEGMLMRLYVSRNKTDQSLLTGARKLQMNLPGTRGQAPEGAYSESERDAYYWYYGTQILFQLQGPAWDDWNNQLRPFLVQSQTTSGPMSGSWNPLGPKRDRWGDNGGRIYLTCLNLLMLEVYYRNLPLYADQQ
ncbi:MAG: hypothetical protein MPJ50_05975 [Pirellulales bacterium]|nr:hypothetical protein [Pirellulales bacterium]